MGSAQRLPNGNTLIAESSFGRFFEVTTEGEIVWEYVNPFFGKPFLADEKALRATRFSGRTVIAKRSLRGLEGLRHDEVSQHSIRPRETLPAGFRSRLCREWGRCCSLIPGFGVKFSTTFLCRAHCSLRSRVMPSVRRRWWINVACKRGLSD